MRVIVVDDEKPARMKLEKILKELDQIDYVKAYSDPVEALEHAGEDEPDIAFLDIEMPEMNGLCLAERMMEALPHVDVVFVTAYDKYALQAFRTHAVGYLLKPVQHEELLRQLDSIQKRYKRIGSRESPRLHLFSFGAFVCSTDESGLSPIRYRTEKAEELLAFLLHQNGKAVLRDIICDTLWPEMDMERATKNFYTTCYYLRRMFADYAYPDVIVRYQNSYSLKWEAFKTDLSLFADVSERFNKEKIELPSLEKAVALYRGEYMGDKDYIWSVKMKAFYERSFEKIALYLANELIGRKAFEKAEGVLNNLLRMLPFCEKACECLMLLHLQSGNRAAANRIFKDFEKNFISEIGESPAKGLYRLIR